MLDMLAATTSMIESGLSVIPIAADGTKHPAISVLPYCWDEKKQTDRPMWKPFQSQLPTTEDLKKWFGNGTIRGVAVVGGVVSGNLEILDFDEPGLYEEWLDICDVQGLKAIIETLPLIETP